MITVTATGGRIEGQIKAKLNVGNVTAGTDRIGETKAETGSIGNIKATSGKIDGEINGLKGIGNITAGTSILQSITTAGAGASIGHIRAGAATAGNILGAITANGNILSVVATAVKDEDLPAGSAASGNWNFASTSFAGISAASRLQIDNAPIYVGGDISGGITAGGSIFNVLAHGRIVKIVRADAQLPTVLAYKSIVGNIEGGQGATSVTTYQSLTGNVTASGNARVWAYDDSSGDITSVLGSVTATSWAVLSGNIHAVSQIAIGAFQSIVAGDVVSTAGGVRQVSNGGINSNVEAKGTISTVAGGDVGGKHKTTAGGEVMAAVGNWNAEVQAAGKVVAGVLGSLQAKVISEWRSVTVKFAKALTEDVEGPTGVFVDVQTEVAGNLTSNATIYVNADTVTSKNIRSSGGSIGINAFSDVSAKTIDGYEATAVYSRGRILGSRIHAQNGNASVYADSVFDTYVRSENKGNTTVISNDSFFGESQAYSREGDVEIHNLGSVDATVWAGKKVDIGTWSSLRGSVRSGTDATLFARYSIYAPVTSIAGNIRISAGSEVKGEVQAQGDQNTVSIFAFNEVSGNVSAGGQIDIFAGAVTKDVTSTSGGVTATVYDNVTGKIKAHGNIAIHAGTTISSGGGGFPDDPDNDKITFEVAGIASAHGDVTIEVFEGITNTTVFAGMAANVTSAKAVSGLHSLSGTGAGFTFLDSAEKSSFTSTSGDIKGFVGKSAELTLFARNGNTSIVAVGDLKGRYNASDEVTLTSFGTVSQVIVGGDTVHGYGLLGVTGEFKGCTQASAESSATVGGTFDADTSIVIAGTASSATLTSRRESSVVAGTSVSGSVASDGTAKAVARGRGLQAGNISATVRGKLVSESIAIGGSISAEVKSEHGSALVVATQNVSGKVEAATDATVIALGNVSGSTVKAGATAKVFAMGNISSSVTAEQGRAIVVAGRDISGAVNGKALVVSAAVSGVISGAMTSSSGSVVALSMDGQSGKVEAQRNAIVLSGGEVSGTVKATEGFALVVSVGAGVTASVNAGTTALVLGLDSLTSDITAGGSIVALSLTDIKGALDAGLYNVAIAGGAITGGSITAGKSALVVAVNDVSSSVTAEDGSLLILSLSNVTSTVSATGIAAIITLGDVDVRLAKAQDLIVICGGKSNYQNAEPDQQTTAGFAGASTPNVAHASRDMVLVSTGGITGNVRSDRDVVFVSLGGSTSSITAGGDAIVVAFDGLIAPSPDRIPTVVAGGDAIVVTAASSMTHITGGKNAILISQGSISGSTISASNYAAGISLGAANNVHVDGADGAFVWTYGNFSGHVKSSAGSAVLATIGSASNSVVDGKENAVAITVGAFNGTVTAENEFAGIISLLNASGTIHGGKGVLVASDCSVDLDATADEDMIIWSRGNVNGVYHAGRDAAVISHGTYDASLTADRDIVFAYAGDSLKGSLTAGRWIGNGSTTPPGDPTEIDDVFSHGDILAQILAGTSASNDPYKGRIGTIGAIGNAGGVYTAQHINRIRTAGLVTASMQTSSASFAASNDGIGSSTSGGTQIIQNLANLLANVPKPVLDPSQRDEILAEAADEKANTAADRILIEIEIAGLKEALRDLRQSVLENVSELRDTTRDLATAAQLAADVAVNVSQMVMQAIVVLSRLATEKELNDVEASFREELSKYVNFRDSSYQQMFDARQEAWGSRLQAKEELKNADLVVSERQTALRNRFAAERADRRLMWEARIWKLSKDLAGEAARDLYNPDEQVDYTPLLDSIETALDVAGMLPIVGVVPDLMNVVFTAARGKWGTAGFNLVSAIPGIGDALKGSKMLAKGAKAADTTKWLATGKAQNLFEAAAKKGNDLSLGKNPTNGNHLLDEAAKLVDDSMPSASKGLVPAGARRLGKWGEDRLEALFNGAGLKPQNPFPTSMGNRYVDRLVNGVAHESKAGIDVKLTSSIWRQILKDKELIDEGLIRGAHWHFWQGASQEVLDALKSLGIKYTVH